MTNEHIPARDELNAMTPVQYKTLENRLRAAAKRQGLRLEKSRARDPRALTCGTYWLVDPYYNTMAAGDTRTGYGLSLIEIAQALYYGQNQR